MPLLKDKSSSISAKGGALGREGAQILSGRITRYWRRDGYVVNCRVEPLFPDDPVCETYVIRSDMINGLPRGWRM
jgi:hypothetical protein